MILTEATALALHSMIYITNRENEIVSLKQISEKFDVSSNHLSKVLQRLVKAGYLISVKGPKGGFKITDKKNATFMEIYEVTEGKKTKKSCLFASKSQNCPQCIMKNLVQNINNEFDNYMNSHKITDFKI